MNVHAPLRHRTRDRVDVNPVGSADAEKPSVAVADVEGCVAVLQERLDRLQAEVRQAQQLAALGVMAASMAHEFRNLLSPVRGYLQAALAEDDPELTKKAMTVALRHVDILSNMSNRVLSTTAQTSQACCAVPVRETVEHAVEALCRNLSKDSISLKVDVDPDLTVWAVPQSLQQVIFNLVVNAQQAMARAHGGRLKITGESRGDRVVIHVRDNGGGIDPEILPHLFDVLASTKSFRDDEPRRCTGLGLALCRDLVEECGGKIDVESELGVGTCFLIDLPANKPETA